ncbi:MAG: S-layer homology domain-containing protein [Clostridiales Family XIII bacterium]|jgi:hypothetical protein|nr:S-layer homology domain-containing protein [Clostridiales Family XIII bacterium]
MKNVSFSIIIVMLVLALSSPPNTGVHAAEINFPDTEGHWARTAIQSLAELGCVSGMPDGNFHPDEILSLEQFTAIVIRSKYGVLPPSGGNWASGYIKMAVGKGLLDGADMSDDGRISRGTAAKILDIASGVLFEEDSVNDTSIADENITDFPSCHTCRTHVANVYTMGIMTGKPGRIFDSEGALTRAEGCVAVMRLIDKDLRVNHDKLK